MIHLLKTRALNRMVCTVQWVYLIKVVHYLFSVQRFTDPK